MENHVSMGHIRDVRQSQVVGCYSSFLAWYIFELYSLMQLWTPLISGKFSTLQWVCVPNVKIITGLFIFLCVQSTGMTASLHQLSSSWSSSIRKLIALKWRCCEACSLMRVREGQPFPRGSRMDIQHQWYTIWGLCPVMLAVADLWYNGDIMPGSIVLNLVF